MARNFNARAGQQIAGNLYRGSSGKFQSGPTDAGLKKLGIQRELSDALINALNNKNLTPENVALLKKQGLMDESGILSPNGRSLALSLRAKNLTNAKKVLDKMKKGKKAGGGGGSKTKANQNKSRKFLATLGIGKALSKALYSFFDGEALTPQQRTKFEKLGLISTNDGTTDPRLTLPGRMLRTAVNSADKRKIQDAVTRGEEFYNKQQAKKVKNEEMDMIDGTEFEYDFEEEDIEEMEEMKDMPHYVPFNVTSFGQLEQIKQAEEIRRDVMNVTNAFTRMVTNVVSNDSVENKVSALETLFNEYAGIMSEVLNVEDRESDDNGFDENSQIEPHSTAVDLDPAWNDFTVSESAKSAAPEVLQYSFAHYAGGDLNESENYSFLHHEGMNAPANIHAVNRCLVNLSEHGDQLSEEDRDRVSAHLRRHRSEAGLLPELNEQEIKTAVSSVALSEGWSKEAKEKSIDLVQLQESKHFESSIELDDMGTAVDLQESDQAGTAAFLDVRLIKPGWGNERDNNFYPANVLKRDSGIFNEIKMHVTNHKSEEHNDRYWVSTITEAGKRFDENGSPIVRVAIHSPAFAKRARILKEIGLLHMLQCSIVAAGKVKRNFKEGDRKGSLVERMTYARSVDWVSYGGAGGQALNLIENISEEHMQKETEVEDLEELEDAELNESSEETETAVDNENNNDNDETAVAESAVLLEESVIQNALKDTTLPDVSRDRILGMQFSEMEELTDAIQKESKYVAKLMGKPEPHQFHAEINEEKVEYDPEKAKKRYDDIFKEFDLIN